MRAMAPPMMVANQIRMEVCCFSSLFSFCLMMSALWMSTLPFPSALMTR